MEFVALDDLQEWLDAQIRTARQIQRETNDPFVAEAIGHVGEAYQQVRLRFVGSKLEDEDDK